MELYSYFRSSAAYRVRIALNLKGLQYDYRAVHLLKDGGQQLAPQYCALNPNALVPALVDGDAVLTQSLAIVEYLEETHPQPPLLPSDALGRARVRAIAQTIACDIHPLNNLRVLKYLKHELKVSEEAKNAWYKHWVELGLAGSRPCWPARRIPGASAMATRRPWPICAWCRNWPMRAASAAICRPCRRWPASKRHAPNCPLFSRQRLPRSPTPSSRAPSKKGSPDGLPFFSGAGKRSRTPTFALRMRCSTN